MTDSSRSGDAPLPHISAPRQPNDIGRRGDDAVEPVLRSFIAWLERFGELSYDPHDFWAHPTGQRAKQIYYRRPVFGVLAVAPFVALDTFFPSSRRFIAVPRRYPIADALYAAGFFRWAAASGDVTATTRGLRFLEELARSRSDGYENLCWGYPFDWESRLGTIRAGTPLITTVPYAYEAFELACEATGDSSHLQAMESIATFAYERIPVTELGDGCAAAAYTPFLRGRVVNASAYRGFLLAAAGRRLGRPDWLHEADRNIAFVLISQRTDGSWPYGTEEGDEFVDNFHTCLVLKNLVKFWNITKRSDVLDAVKIGYAFYRARLLDERLQPIPFAVKPRLTLHRHDLYDYAEGIHLARLVDRIEPDARDILAAMTARLVSKWVHRDGHFVTRRFLVGRNTVPYHRWGQAQTFHALSSCCDCTI